jgi:hypothetical protein
MRLFLALALAGTMLAAGPSKESKDPLIGKWILNGEKSTFKPGPVPDQRIMTFEAVPNGFKHSMKTTSAFGGDTDVVYTAKYDGKDYPMDPLTPLDTVSLKRIDANTVERTGKAQHKEVETTTLEVSPDGNTLTMTVNGSDRGGCTT